MGSGGAGVDKGTAGGPVWAGRLAGLGGPVGGAGLFSLFCFVFFCLCFLLFIFLYCFILFL